jgi:PAS domain S-box-containing protein
MNEENKSDSSKLRQKAKEVLKTRISRNASSISDAEMRYLHHELEVSKIELEIQNEELRHANAESGFNRFRQALDKSGEAIFLTDFEGVFTYINEGFTKLYGYTSDELIGKVTPRILKSNLLNSEVYEEFWKAISSSIEVKGEILNRHKEGHLIQIEGSANSIHDENNNIVGYLGIQHDISERKLAEKALKESEHEFRNIFDNIGEGIGFVNPGEEFVLVNPAARRIFGETEGKLVGKNLREFLTDDEFLSIQNQTKIRKKGQKSSYEIEIQRSNGEKRSLVITAVPQSDSDGNFIGTLGIFRDITDRKEIEDALRASESKLLKLNADKDRFMAILAHDLKGPFNSLLGFSELLAENIRHYDIDKIESLVSFISKSAKSAFVLLENLLMWTQSQSGKIPFEPQKLKLNEVFTEVLEILQPTADSKNIVLSFQTTEKMSVFADREMLKTILRNLVSNAIKFTMPGGKVDIIAEKTPEHRIISVIDSGIGIPPAKLDKLFDALQIQSTKGTGNESGTGLGLLLCRDFVERHDGKIWAESRVGKGSIFKISLPKAK